MASIWDELKRRKVFQVAVVYAIVGWVLAQVAATMFPILLLPDWILRAFVIVILFGFPIAIVLAWAFETTPSGIQRDAGSSTAGESGDGSPKSAVSPTILIAAALIIGFVLGGLIGRTTVPPTEMIDSAKTPVQLTANPQSNPVISSAISPDGKYLAYTEASGLFLRIIDSGESHQVSLSDEMQFSRSRVTWFPDGTNLLLAAQIDLVPSLWKLGILGGIPRKLADGAAHASISRDGTRIAYLPRYFASNVFLMGSEGEEPTEVYRDDARSVRELGWSPDSSKLLLGSVGRSFGQQKLQALDIESGELSIIMEDPRTFQAWRGYLPFYWAPDGYLLFAMRDLAPSERSSNLWRVQLDSATAGFIGNPTQFTRLTGYNFADISMTSDGKRIAFLLEKNQSDVYLAELLDDNRRITNDRRFTVDERDDYPAGWSTDGSEIFIQSDRGPTTSLFTKTLDGDSARLLATSVSTDEDNVQRSPDGEWVLYWDSGDILMRVPVGGGPAEIVLSGTTMSDFHCPKKGAAGDSCIVSIREDDNLYVFYEFNPEYGLGKKLLSVEDQTPFSNWSLSPDGTTAALVHNSNIVRLIDLATGIEEEHSVPGWNFGEYVDWSSDGAVLFMDGTANSRTFKKSLIYYDIETREAGILREFPSQWHVVPKASPDGKHLAVGLMIFSGNAWMIENP